MLDQDPILSDNSREAKLLAARKKLKKFQSRKLANHDSEGEFSSQKASQEGSRADGVIGVLFNEKGSPLVKSGADDIPQPTSSTKSESNIAYPTTSLSPSQEHHTKNAVSSPPETSTNHSSSVTTDPTGNLGHEAPLSYSSLSHQLELEVGRLVTKFDQIDGEKDDRMGFIQRGLDSLAKKHHLLENDYNKVNQQLLATIDSHQSKVADMEVALKTTRNEIATLKDDHSLQRSQHESNDYKAKWEQVAALVEDQKQKMVELEASNSDFQAETARLIDMVNDLEEALAKTQADNYNNDCEIKTLSTKVNSNINGESSANRDIDTLSADLKQITQERDTLAEKMESFQDQIQADQRRLDSLEPKLEAALQELVTLKTQLEEKDNEIRDLKAKLETKENDAATHSDELSQLQRDHDAALKEATDKLEHQITELQQSLESKTRDHSELVISRNELDNVVSGLKQQLDKVIDGSITKDDGVNTLMASIKQLEQQHDTMKQQLKEATHQMEDDDKTLHHLREQIHHLEQDRDQLKQQLHESQEAAKAKSQALEESTTNLGVLEQQYSSLQQILDEKETLYADLVQAKKNLERDVTARNLTSNSQQQQIIDRINHLNQRIDQVTKQYGGIEQKASGIETNLTARELEWQHKQSDWNSKAEQHGKDLDSKRSELGTLQQSLVESASQAKSHLNKLTDMEARVLEHQLYIGKLETDQHGFEEKGRFLEEQMTMIQAELDGQRVLAENLEETRSGLLEEKTKLESRLESSHNNLEAQQTLVDTLNTQLQNRTDQIKQLEAKIERLELSLQGNDGKEDEWETKYNGLNQQYKEQTLAQQALVMEKDQREVALSDIKETMANLQAHATNLEQQLALAHAATGVEQSLSKETLDDKNTFSHSEDTQEDLAWHQEKIESLEKHLGTLQQQLTDQSRLYDEKVAALESANGKRDNMEKMLEHTRYQWMMEQTKVANMTEEISQLRWQLQHQVKDQQNLQRRLDETKQLLANRDQNTEALQWQVTDMESSVRYQLDQLNGHLKEAQEQVIEKSKQVDQLQKQLEVSKASSSPTVGTAIGADLPPLPTNDPPQEPSTSPTDTSSKEEPPLVSEPQAPTDREAALETELKELRQRLERQFDAFTTIRGELTTVRDRQLNAEINAQKEKQSLIQERQELEQTIERLRTEYQEHLERMWAQHQAMREHHEEDLTLGRDALDAAQVKLMQNGLSPVSENGFEWVNTDSEDDGDDDNKDGDDGDDNDDDNDDAQQPLVTDKSPLVGSLPPLQKPAFFEFMETPRCSGCQTDVIDI